MKKIPNLITCCRILLTVCLPFTVPFGKNFLILYTLCGVSDMADGYLARRLNLTSNLGSLLDTVADTLFLFTAGIILLLQLSFPAWLLYSAATILCVRLVTYTIGFFRFRQWASLHTWLNKLTGFLLFVTPYIYNFIAFNNWGKVVVIIAILSAIDELLIVVFSTELDKNCASFFTKDKSH